MTLGQWISDNPSVAERSLVGVFVLTFLLGPYVAAPVFLLLFGAFAYFVGIRPRGAGMPPLAPKASVVTARLSHDAWADLLRLAPKQEARIAAARSSCDRFVLLADGRALDPQSVDTLNSVTVHLPRLIAEAQEIARHADPDEARSVAMRAVAAAERIGAAADSARDHLLSDARDRFSTSAAFLETRHPEDLLAAPIDGTGKGLKADPNTSPQSVVREDPSNYFESLGDRS